MCLLCGMTGLGLVAFQMKNKNIPEQQQKPSERPVILPSKVDAEQPKVESINSEGEETERKKIEEDEDEEKVTAIVKERY